MTVEKDQHMMIDKQTIKKIIDFAQIKKDETILEIGPGTGNLTKELAGKSKKVIAIEIDPSFEAGLIKMPDIKVVIGNALDEIEKTEFDKLVSNIPYAICEPLIYKMITKNFKLSILTVPEGFVDILLAKTGDVLFSKLSAISAEFFEISVILKVPRESFNPVPKTNSVVIKIKPRADNILIQEVLKRGPLKVKNAIVRALFIARKLAKNDAKKALNATNLTKYYEEKKINNLNCQELCILIQKLKSI